MLRPVLDFFWESSETLVTCSSATGFLFDEFVQATDGNATFMYGGSTVGTSQSFLAGDAGEITGLCLRLRNQGSPTGRYRVSVRAHSGTFGTSSVPTGPDLVASGLFDVSDLSTSPADYFFALSGWTPEDGTPYTIVVTDVDLAGDNSNKLFVIQESAPDNTAAGNHARLATSWAFDSADMAFKIYFANEAAPPYTEDPLKTIDYGTRAVVTVSNTLSSDETNALKIDLSQLSPEEGTGKPVTQVYIEQIKAVTSGLDVDILWDATTPEPCLLLTGDSGVSYDFRAVGPLTNNAGAGKTGNILFSTNGASAGSSYSVTLVMRKKY